MMAVASALGLECCRCVGMTRLGGGFGVGSPGESAGEGRAATGPTSGSALEEARMSRAFELCTDEATA